MSQSHGIKHQLDRTYGLFHSDLFIIENRLAKQEDLKPAMPVHLFLARVLERGTVLLRRKISVVVNPLRMRGRSDRVSCSEPQLKFPAPLCQR